ncbi:MAG: POTRA domain-containing protein [Bacteroidota bacterium]
MKRYFLYIVVVPFFICQAQYKQQSYFIDEVQVEAGKSNITFDSEEKQAIKKAAKIPIKKLLDIPFQISPIINRAIKILLACGYHASIQKEVKKSNKNNETRTVIKIIIHKKLPKIAHIQWVGIPYSEKSILERLAAFQVNHYYHKHQLKQAASYIKNHFLKKGYLDVFVQVRAVQESKNLHKIVVKVHKGKKYYIEQVIFQGNQKVHTLSLSKQIPLYGKETKGFQVLKENILYHIKKKEILELFYSIYEQIRPSMAFTKASVSEAVSLLLNYYHYSKGFLNAEIATHLKIDRAYGKVTIIFLIKERTPFVVNQITWLGNESFQSEELTKAVGFSEGMPYSITKISRLLQSKDSLKGLYSLYEKKGAFLSLVTLTSSLISKNKVDITINLREIKSPKIISINIEGNLNKKIGKGILAANNLEVGKVFHSSNLLFARKELRSSGLLDTQKMQIRAVEQRKKDKAGVIIDSYLPVNIDSSAYLRLDLEKIACHFLLTNIDISPFFEKMNLPKQGGGMFLEISLTREHDSLKRYMPFSLDIELKQPWIFIRGHHFIVGGRYRYTEHPTKDKPSYRSRLVELAIGDHYNYGPRRIERTISASHTQGEKMLPNRPIKTDFTKYEACLKYQESNVNHFFFPTEGYNFSLNIDIAFPPGKIQYLRPHLHNKWYFPFNSYILMQRIEGGINLSKDGKSGNFFLNQQDEMSYPIYLIGHNKGDVSLFSNQNGGDIYFIYHAEVRRQIFGKNDYLSLFASIAGIKQTRLSDYIAKRWCVGIGFTQRFRIGPLCIYLVWTDSIIPGLEIDWHKRRHAS